MHREVLLSTTERQFITTALREEKRIDGRKPFDFRPIKIQFGDSPGQAMVLLGQTRVYTAVTCQIVEPYPDRANEGLFSFHINFSPMASPSFESSGRPSDFGIELGRVLERGLRQSGALDTEALCIIAREKVWSIRCDVHVLDHYGNLIDCASIATITALLHFRKPDVTIHGSSVTVHGLSEREPVPLSIHHIPVSITFGFFEDGEFILVDPSLKEELVQDGRMTLTVNDYGEICAVQKPGGTPLPVSTVFQTANIAVTKAAEITTKIKHAIKTSNASQHSFSSSFSVPSAHDIPALRKFNIFQEMKTEHLTTEGVSLKDEKESVAVPVDIDESELILTDVALQDEAMKEFEEKAVELALKTTGLEDRQEENSDEVERIKIEDQETEKEEEGEKKDEEEDNDEEPTKKSGKAKNKKKKRKSDGESGLETPKKLKKGSLETTPKTKKHLEGDLSVALKKKVKPKKL